VLLDGTEPKQTGGIGSSLPSERESETAYNVHGMVAPKVKERAYLEGLARESTLVTL